MTDAPRRRAPAAGTFAAAMVGAAAVALCDALHELAHVAVALPLGVPVVTISSVGISTATSSPAVALAGPLVNATLAGALPVARSRAFAAEWRCFAWLFGTVNLFDCVAYLLYSALLGSGDWATVFAAFSPPMLWRPAAALAGAALYGAAVFGSLGVLRVLIADGVVSHAAARRGCLTAYCAGGLLLTAAAALNPISAWLILTSGVATGFGAMAGLAFIAALLKDTDGAPARQTSAARYGLAWLLACLAVSLAFVFVLGPGIRLPVAAADGDGKPYPPRTEARMQRYYADRAPEYDSVYAKPERQADLRLIERWLAEALRGRTVLEIASGTGHWTQFIAPVAARVVAIDSAAETIAIARQRVPPARVEFVIGDAYALPDLGGKFSAGFAGFWVSHVPKARVREFLRGFHACLEPGARVVLLDNRFVAGSSTPISERDGEGNTYQTRSLRDGTTHRVLKNFPTEGELRSVTEGLCSELRYLAWQHYWAVEYAAVAASVPQRGDST